MKLTLFQKLFGAIFLTSMVVVGIMVGSLQYTATTSFENYINSHELLRVRGLEENLQQFYRNSGGWEVLYNNKRQWYGMVKASIEQGARKRGWEHRPPPPQKRFVVRFSLYDANRQLIVGRGGGNEKDHLFKPIELDGQTVGWVGLKKIKTFTNALDSSFLDKYIEGLYWIGGGILILVLGISFLVSRPLRSKIQLLTEGAQQIAARKFHTRIEVQSTDELGQLASDFNQMAQTLENYENYRKQWISDISHELGTPLSIIQGGLEAMIDGVRELSVDNLNTLHAQVGQISQIANDLRLLSLADTGALSMHKTLLSPANVIQDLLHGFEDKYQEKAIELRQRWEAPTSTTIAGDPQRLKQVFSNILENGLRYIDTPGHLTIGSQVKGSSIWIYFEDSGPGVPEEALPHIFDRLYRVEGSRMRAKGGSGLGLAICKQIVNLHGGSIEAKNTTEGGLRIEITFPISSKL